MPYRFLLACALLVCNLSVSFGQVVKDSTITLGIKDTTPSGNLDIRSILDWHFSFENPDTIREGLNLKNSFPVDLLDIEEIKKSEQWNHHGWFEAEFIVDSTLYGLPFELTVFNQQAVDVWLNGRLVLESGNPSENPEKEILSRWPDYYYKGMMFREGRNFLLLEYSDHTAPTNIELRDAFDHAIDIRLFRKNRDELREKNAVIFGGVSMLLILLMLIHSYLAYTFKKGYHLYVVLTTLFIFLHAVAALSYTLIDWTFLFQYYVRFTDATAFIFVLYFYLISIRKFYELSIPWKTLSISMGILLAAALYSVVFFHELINIINPILGIGIFIYGFYSLYEAKKESEEHSILSIAAGFLFTVGGALLYAIFYRGFGIDSTPLLLMSTLFAYTSIPISMTFNVAQSYAKLFRTLDTKVKERTAELEASNEYKTKFFANISHEFRTPLTISEGLLKRVIQEKKEDPYIHKELSIAVRNMDRLHDMVDQIIDLTKSDQKHLTLNKKYYKADSIAAISVESFRSLAEYHNHSFQFFAKGDDSVLYADRSKLEIMINNLISNAIKFTPEGGAIEVRTFIDSDNYVLEVKDSGPGIPIGEEEAIFERFHRIKREDEDYVEGMGVGLELSRSLATLHGGKINVIPNQEKGALFQLQLPIVIEYDPKKIQVLESDDDDPIQSPKTEINAQSHSFDILLVEDNEDMMHYVSEVLSPLGNIKKAKNGLEALAVLQKYTPDLIVTDLMMPKMGGQKLVERLSKNKEWKNIPVIVLTAKALERSKLDLLRIGVVDYITKPFLPEQLLLKTRNLLKFYLIRTKLKVQVSAVELSEFEGFKEKVSAFILENLSDTTLSVDRIANTFLQSRRTFYRNIQTETGMTPAEFIREIRLTSARNIVANNKNIRLDELTKSVGYKSTAGFKRAFKQRFGINPLD